MRFIVYLCILSIFSFLAVADLPPSNDSFRVSSINGEWSALVYNSNSQAISAERKWLLAIYEGAFHPSKQPTWQTTFHHTGYSGGSLSEDGKTFVVVNQWYFHNQPIVFIYTANCVRTVNGTDLKIKEHQLRSTVSHQTWLKNLEVEFVVNNNAKNIKIDTVSGEWYLSENCGNAT